MGDGANPVRGEALLRVGGERLVLRPSFAALVAAEGELGSLFALVERAAEGKLGIGEMVGLFWHCLHAAPEGITRERLGEAVVEAGLAAATPVLRVLLRQILAGTGRSARALRGWRGLRGRCWGGRPRCSGARRPRNWRRSSARWWGT